MIGGPLPFGKCLGSKMSTPYSLYKKIEIWVNSLYFLGVRDNWVIDYA